MRARFLTRSGILARTCLIAADLLPMMRTYRSYLLRVLKKVTVKAIQKGFARLYTQRGACRLVGLEPKACRYAPSIDRRRAPAAAAEGSGFGTQTVRLSGLSPAATLIPDNWINQK